MQANNPEFDPEVVIYAHEVGTVCPVCGQEYVSDVYDTYTPDARWEGRHCFNCQTSFPVKPEPGVMDEDDDIPF